jgi:signal transduction histidine kinase
VRKHKDGSLIDVSLTISPILDAQGQVVGASKIARDMTERIRLERAVLEAADDERRRLGHDLHDGLGQELTGLAMLAAALESSERRAGRAAAQKAATIEHVARQAIATCRSIARGLSPLGSGAGGLVTALEEMVALHRETFGIDVRFEATNAASLRLPQEVGDQLYRIAQEAVTNARRHASAKQIRVALVIREASVRLDVLDDGIGFATPASAAPGMGLRIMQFRAGTIGALLSIGPAEHGGTLVTCECAQPVPLGNAEPSIRAHADGGY